MLLTCTSDSYGMPLMRAHDPRQHQWQLMAPLSWAPHGERLHLAWHQWGSSEQGLALSHRHGVMLSTKGFGTVGTAAMARGQVLPGSLRSGQLQPQGQVSQALPPSKQAVLLLIWVASSISVLKWLWASGW